MININRHFFARIWFCLLIVVCLVFLGTVQTAKAVGSEQKKLPSYESYDSIGRVIDEFADDTDSEISGVSVAVFDSKDVIHEGYYGYADIENKIHMDEDTVVEWGSVSKLLVWISAMQLVEQGKLELDRDIRDYLPKGFLHNLRYEKPITMLNLMEHNAGFEDTVIGMFVQNENEIISLEDYLSHTQPDQISEPGRITSYSNWSSALAGYIIERISGEPYYDYVRKHIFTPLGMERTAIRPDLSDNEYVHNKRKELKCYDSDGNCLSECYCHIIPYPAGMCTSTLTDLRIFAQELLRPDGRLFEKRSTYVFMFTPQSYIGDTVYIKNCHGFWGEHFNENTIGHGGNTLGCSSQLLIDIKDNVGMVIMINQKSEHYFTDNLPQKVFGLGVTHETVNYTGFVQNMRTIYTGPLSIYRAFSISYANPEDLSKTISERVTEGDTDIISAPYGDLLIISDNQANMLIIPVVVWVITILFCCLCIPVKSIRFIVRKIKKKPTKTMCGIWSTVSIVLQILFVLSMAFSAYTIISYNYMPVIVYRLWSVSAMILMVLFVVLAVIGVIRQFRESASPLRKIVNSTVIVTLLISAASIGYWQMFMFWKI